MNGDEVKRIPCDKPIALGILEQLVDAKINHLFNAEGNMVMARFTMFQALVDERNEGNRYTLSRTMTVVHYKSSRKRFVGRTRNRGLIAVARDF